jgi:pyruvate/2-oxoglutarate dehydrogenase complex dihydrolipoamide dehydrogenase (E3) component
MQRSGCLLSDFDEEIGKTINEVSRRRGIDVLCSASAKRVRKCDGGIVVEIERGGKNIEISGSHLLIATGRRPATDGLALEAAGVEVEKMRVKVNQHAQTNRDHIFAIGDCSNELPVVHKAVNQGESVARYIAINAGYLQAEIEAPGNQELELFGIFTHPECARAGMTNAQISEAGYDVETAQYNFSDHGKAEILGETDGFVKITAEKTTGRILSASAVGPHVIDLIHELQVAIHAGMSVADLAKIPHYHPTLAEIWTYPAEELR